MQSKAKGKGNLSVLMDYAGRRRVLTYLSWVLSAVSALMALVPFVFVWLIVREVIRADGNFAAVQGSLSVYGWWAVGSALISMLIYFAALMCSHVAAFRVAGNMRKKAMRHIGTLPVGFMNSLGSGRVRRIVNESSGATETYLAHQLPDMVGAFATPVGMIVLLFVFDWRLGLLSLIPTVLGFIIMSKMTGKDMARKMKEYQSALENMNNEAVEYVRGVPVVKTFGQTVFSFKRFKGSIDSYHTWVIAYTKEPDVADGRIHDRHQLRVRAAHQRGALLYGGRCGRDLPAESHLLYHFHAHHLCHADEGHVHEREQYDRFRRLAAYRRYLGDQAAARTVRAAKAEGQFRCV